MKPGWKTTEFWVVVVSSLLAVGVAGGYVTPDQATSATNATGQAFEAAMKLVEALVPIVGPVVYVWSRTRIKQSM